MCEFSNYFQIISDPRDCCSNRFRDCSRIERECGLSCETGCDVILRAIAPRRSAASITHLTQRPGFSSLWKTKGTRGRRDQTADSEHRNRKLGGWDRRRQNQQRAGAAGDTLGALGAHTQDAPEIMKRDVEDEVNEHEEYRKFETRRPDGRLG